MQPLLRTRSQARNRTSASGRRQHQNFSGLFPGSGGDDDLIYSVFASSSSVVNPEPASDTDINSMSLTFTLAAQKDCIVLADVRAVKSAGGSLMRIKEGGVTLAPSNDGAGGVFPGWETAGASSDTTNKQWSVMTVLTLAAGSHTLKLTHQALGNTNSITFLDRSLVVLVPSN